MGSQFAVLPSFTEGTPNAVLEAMATGLPVVASRVGGVPELIQDGVEGYLVNPGEVDELARALQQVVDNPDWRQVAGRQARLRVRDFTWGSMAKHNLEVMKQSTVMR
jgi:Glycosyltransferase